MFKQHLFKSFVSGFILLTSLNCFGEAQPKFSIIPLSNPHVQVTSGEIATVSYQITNNLSDLMPLILDMNSLGGKKGGIQQFTRGQSSCSTPNFSLQPNASCQLTLEINGDSVGMSGTRKTYSGPKICINSGGSPSFSCSQPSPRNSLSIEVNSIDEPQFAYVANYQDDSLSICSLINGQIDTCEASDGNGTFSHPSSVVVNPAGTHLYIANEGSTTISICPFNKAELGTCVTSNANNTLLTPTTLAIDATTNQLYLTSNASSAILKCPINTDGSLGNCSLASNFTDPLGLMLNSAGSYAFLTNINDVTTMDSCLINPDGTIGTCTANTQSAFTQLLNISLNQANTYAYLSNAFGSLAICPLNQDGSLGTCSSTTGNGTFFSGGYGGLFTQSTKNIGYFTNFPINTVSVCPINGDGSLGFCTTSDGNGTFVTPTSITIYPV